jgi:hypothetical protein
MESLFYILALDGVLAILAYEFSRFGGGSRAWIGPGRFAGSGRKRRSLSAGYPAEEKK